MPAPPPYPDWPAYRQILAERFGFVMRQDPAETSWPWRGHRIHIDIHTPNAPPKGTLILVHGAGGNGRILAPIGQVAADLGWTVLAPDLPAYGVTELRPGWVPDYADWPQCLADLAEDQVGPVVLMGLSLGGMTALRAAQLSPKVCGVIATTLIDMGDADTFIATARWPWLGHLALWTMRTLPWLMDRLSFPLALVTPLDKMTTDPALQAWFKRSTLIGKCRISGRFIRSLHQYRPNAPGLSLTCTLLLVHPGQDTWTPLPLSQAVFDRVPGTDKQLTVLTNGAHMPVETPAWQELCERVGGFLARVEGVGTSSGAKGQNRLDKTQLGQGVTHHSR